MRAFFRRGQGFLLFLLWVDLALPQEVPNLINFTTPNLEAQHQNWKIVQGEDQRMYFANSNGLLRFDGQHWDSFSLPENQAVRALGMDEEGNIFGGGYGEFGFWSYDSTDRLFYHSLSASLPSDLIASQEIWQLLIGPDWVLFQSFTTFFLYDYEKVSIITPPGGGNISLAHWVGDKIYLLKRGECLMELKVRGDALRFKSLKGSEVFARMDVIGIMAHKSHDMLICTARNGIFYKDGSSYQAWNHGYGDEFEKNQLNRVLALADGGYAWGSILDGVYITSGSGEARFHLEQSSGLQNNTVLSLYQDRRRHLWIGLDDGVDMVDLDASLQLFKDLRGELGSVYAASYFDGDLYLGTNHGLFRKTQELPPYFTLVGGTQGQVWQLSESDKGLFIGHNDGSFLWDGKALREVSSRSGGWCMKRVPGRQNQFIQGTYGGMILLENDPFQGWRQVQAIGGFSLPIKQLAMGEGNNMWAINPYSGMHLLTLDSSLKEVLTVKKITEESGLPTDFSLRLMTVEDDNILKSDGQFFRLEGDSLEEVKQVGGIALEKEIQHVWIGQREDSFLIFADRIEARIGSIRQVFSLRLIPNYEKIEYLGEGEYLLCLVNGYARYRPSFGKQEKLDIPRPLITKVVQLSPERKVLRGHLGSMEGKHLSLAAGQRNLRFNFCLPFYEGKVRFRYRLLGFNEEWSAWGTETFKEYTNLSPGSYRLEVEEEQFRQRAMINFSIAPPWYLSSYALLLFFLMALALISLFFDLHKFLLKKQQRRIAIQKEREFQQKIIREKNEQLRRDVQNKSRELANSTMGLIRKNETLLELKKELDDLYARAGDRLPARLYQKLLKRIDRSLSDEEDWQVFETNFNQVHEQFFQQLKAAYPDLTAGDLRLAAFLRMGLSSKEIAPLFNISLRGIENKRYRLRKKMKLYGQQNLLDVLMTF